MSAINTVKALQWGAAFPAVQAEGAGMGSDWFAWERAGEAPSSFDGNRFATEFAEDFALLAELGADVVRLTLDWARIEPDEGKVDGAVLDRYRALLAAAHNAGLSPWVVLVDGPLPGWFSIDERGWRDRRARSYFWPRHVERVANTFGDSVAAWMAILRPVSFARAAFITASAPPGTRSVQRLVETVQGNYLAALEAWPILRGAAPVALGVEAAPTRMAAPEAERATRLYEALQWAWTGGLHDGELSLPRMPILRVDAMRDAFDAIAVTFEGGYAVDHDGAITRHRQQEELLGTLHRLAEQAGDRPLWIAGHTASHGDPQADIDATELAIADVEAARADGIDLRAWVWEPAIDGYESSAGFDAHLGLFDADRAAKPATEVIRRWRAERHQPVDLAALAEERADPS